MRIGGLHPQWGTEEDTFEEVIDKLNDILKLSNIKSDSIAGINNTKRRATGTCHSDIQEQRGTSRAIALVPPPQRESTLDRRGTDLDSTQD